MSWLRKKLPLVLGENARDPVSAFASPGRRDWERYCSIRSTCKEGLSGRLSLPHQRSQLKCRGLPESVLRCECYECYKCHELNSWPLWACHRQRSAGCWPRCTHVSEARAVFVRYAGLDVRRP